MQSVTLIDRQGERVSVHLEAKITPEGDLRLKAQDLGSLVENTGEIWTTSTG